MATPCRLALTGTGTAADTLRWFVQHVPPQFTYLPDRVQDSQDRQRLVRYLDERGRTGQQIE